MEHDAHSAGELRSKTSNLIEIPVTGPKRLCIYKRPFSAKLMDIQSSVQPPSSGLDWKELGYQGDILWILSDGLLRVGRTDQFIL